MSIQPLLDQANKLSDQLFSAELKIAACERQVNELAEINKELVEGLKEAMDWNWLDDDPPLNVLSRLQALIAKAEQ
jgi:hypothetical protein